MSLEWYERITQFNAVLIIAGIVGALFSLACLALHWASAKRRSDAIGLLFFLGLICLAYGIQCFTLLWM